MIMWFISRRKGFQVLTLLATLGVIGSAHGRSYRSPGDDTARRQSRSAEEPGDSVEKNLLESGEGEESFFDGEEHETESAEANYGNIEDDYSNYDGDSLLSDEDISTFDKGESAAGDSDSTKNSGDSKVTAPGTEGDNDFTAEEAVMEKATISAEGAPAEEKVTENPAAE